MKDIRKAFRNILGDLDWLDPETQRVALKKVSKMEEFIGFPEWLLDPDLLHDYYHGVR